MQPIVVVVADEPFSLLPYRQKGNDFELTLNQAAASEIIFSKAASPVSILKGMPGCGKTTIVKQCGLPIVLKTIGSLVGGYSVDKMTKFDPGVKPGSVGWLVIEDAGNFPPEFYDALDGLLRRFMDNKCKPFGGIRLVLLETTGHGRPMSPMMTSKALGHLRRDTYDEFPDNLRIDCDDVEFAETVRSIVFDRELTGMAAGWIDYNLMRGWLGESKITTCTEKRSRELNFWFTRSAVNRGAHIGEDVEAFVFVPSDFDPDSHKITDSPHFPVMANSEIVFTKTIDNGKIYPGLRGTIESVEVKRKKMVSHDGVNYIVARPNTDVSVKLDDGTIVKVEPIKSGIGLDGVSTRKEWPMTAAMCLPVWRYKNQTVDRLVFDATGMSDTDNGLNYARLAFTRTAKTGDFSVVNLDYGHDTLTRLMRKVANAQ